MPDSPDWAALERLRRAFIEGTAGHRDYWLSAADLASYDRTFAQRIGWKWDFVLTELQQRGWSPPPGEWWDWGCGSGIAGRAFLDHFGTQGASRFRLIDRSRAATDFARSRLAERFPDLPLASGMEGRPDLILLSHILTELNPTQIDSLIDQIAGATAILWVEPGTHAVSRQLVRIRERLRSSHTPVAPCVHSGSCRLTTPGLESDWCHQFAPPPPGIFADAFWVEFAQRLGLDLRSLPVAYLVLDRRGPLPLPPFPARLLGHPETHKAGIRLFLCETHSLGPRSLSKRDHPDLCRQARKGSLPSLLSLPQQPVKE